MLPVLPIRSLSAREIQTLPTAVLSDICRRWQVREFSLFGSVLREDFGAESDVDVLVSFEESAPWSLWDLMDLQDELQTLFGRPVDLVEPEAIRNPFRRKEILETRRVLFSNSVRAQTVWSV